MLLSAGSWLVSTCTQPDCPAMLHATWEAQLVLTPSVTSSRDWRVIPPSVTVDTWQGQLCFVIVSPTDRLDPNLCWSESVFCKLHCEWQQWGVHNAVDICYPPSPSCCWPSRWPAPSRQTVSTRMFGFISIQTTFLYRKVQHRSRLSLTLRDLCTMIWCKWSRGLPKSWQRHWLGGRSHCIIMFWCLSTIQVSLCNYVFFMAWEFVCW